MRLFWQTMYNISANFYCRSHCYDNSVWRWCSMYEFHPHLNELDSMYIRILDAGDAHIFPKSFAQHCVLSFTTVNVLFNDAFMRARWELIKKRSYVWAPCRKKTSYGGSLRSIASQCVTITRQYEKWHRPRFIVRSLAAAEHNSHISNNLIYRKFR